MDWESLTIESVDDSQISRVNPDSVREKRKTAKGREELTEMGITHTTRPKPVSQRLFVGWDGEGITYTPGHPQSYVLFGASTGHYVESPALGTVECLDCILQADLDCPKRIHVGFAFSYDVEMICRDIPAKVMKHLYRNNRVRWGKYRLEYIPNKWFSVSGKIRGRKRSVKIWDIFSFFGESFVKSLRKYLGDVDNLRQIEEGKASRNEFKYSELETLIKPYWKLELDLLVQLASKLRELLSSAGIDIKQWHGPGAVATRLFTSNNTDNYRAESPDRVKDAAQFAFAGGRFELFKIGRATKRVYVYDINSAYPAAFAQLPNLKSQWRKVYYPETIERFGVYHVQFDCFTSGYPLTTPQPFFFRDDKSCVHFPQIVDGWYWSPEAKIALQHPDATITEGWVLEDTGDYPLDWVRDLYNQRKQWKNDKIQAELALKLGINSLYGKTAQRVGWKTDRLPRWHQLEWAGYITSYTRALLWEAIQQAMEKDSLIACETDSVISSEPLDLPISEKLGDWDVKTYEDIIYLQNGVYWVLTQEGWEAKFRGLDSDSLDVSDVLALLSHADLRNSSPSVFGTTTRFVGGRLAMQTDITRWRTWETSKREISLGTSGKRVHYSLFCQACREGLSPADAMHDLSISKYMGGRSHPHNIPWREMESAYWEGDTEWQREAFTA